MNFQLTNTKKDKLCEYEKKEYENFISFMKKVEDDLNECLYLFLESKGTSYKELVKKGNNLKNVIPEESDYKDFINIFNNSKFKIEKILYREEYNSMARREITDNVFIVKDFINRNNTNKQIIKKEVSILGIKKYKSLIFTIIFLYLILALMKN